MLADILFLTFAAILLVAGLGVVSAKNPMHAVLFMILAFFNAAALFILLGAEFLGLLLIMVYVGAIAVMFLFVVMTIDIDFAELKEGFATYIPIALLVAGVIFAQLLAAAGSVLLYDEPLTLQLGAKEDINSENIRQLGNILFTDYVVPFIGAAMVLLVAMIGAIVLTHRRRTDVKRQSVPKQIARTRTESLVITQPKTGEGVTQSHFVGKSVES